MSEKDEISKALDAQTDSPTGSESNPEEVQKDLNGLNPAAEINADANADAKAQPDHPAEPEPSDSKPNPEKSSLQDDQNLETPEAVQEEAPGEVQDASMAQDEVEPQANQELEKTDTAHLLEKANEASDHENQQDEAPTTEPEVTTTTGEPVTVETSSDGSDAHVTNEPVAETSAPETEKPDSDTDKPVESSDLPTTETSEPAAVPSDEVVSTEPDASAETSLDGSDAQSTVVADESASVSETEKPDSAEPDASAETESPADKDTPANKDNPTETVALPWEQIDFKTLDKAGLVAQIELMAKHDDPIIAERASKELRPLFNAIQREQKQKAQEAFVAEGNEADGFAYRFDELDNRFDAAFKLLRDRKSQRYKDLERDKERNLEEKNQLLEQLRALVEAEETTSSINALKKIQERWKTLGPVPPQHAKTLWANYHALLDLYYDHRSIYFELKELDRKKNLASKLELCDRAEKLVAHENLKEAISELNELHDEFKHIGPVPKNDQEALWQRFKGASDQIYARRKEFVKNLKEDLKENLAKKAVLADEVQEYNAFTSDRISDWNKKTQALLELQKRWDAIGGLPRDQARQINRKFWGAFKGFFRKKGQFFKQLEGEREANLEKKQALVQEAAALKESTDWNGTANKLKNLQKQWRDIGPVPEKFRNSIYAEFKEACDQFFNNKRAQGQQIEKEYVVNLQKKQDICTQLETMTTAKDFDLAKFKELTKTFNEIGYVPGSEVRNIRNQFQTTVNEYLAAAPEEVQEEAREIRDSLEFEKLKSGPNANRKITQKEQALRREIHALENDISTWKNNLEFFAASKTADKLRAEFTDKIDDANQQLLELKRKLRAVRQL